MDIYLGYRMGKWEAGATGIDLKSINIGLQPYMELGSSSRIFGIAEYQYGRVEFPVTSFDVNEYDFGGGAEYDFSKALSIMGEVTYNYYDYSDGADGNDYTLGASLYYWLSDGFLLGGGLDYQFDAKDIILTLSANLGF